jgi:hypothetical protein
MFYWIQYTDDIKLLTGEDGVPFPENHANPHYQAYLAWVAEGNTAEEWTEI